MASNPVLAMQMSHLHVASLEARLRRAEARMDASESDGEYEANRQIIIWLEALIADEKKARAA